MRSNEDAILCCEQVLVDIRSIYLAIHTLINLNNKQNSIECALPPYTHAAT